MPERKIFMEQIKEFTILRVEMEGFKRFKEPFAVDLGTTSYIFGTNGQGKTSIADAIAYAFCGVPLWGEKSCDRLLNRESKAMKVTVKFVDGNGEVHVLCRSRQGSNTVITLDGRQLRQADMAGLFAEKDIFLSVFNPLYFIEKLGEDGGALLQRLLPYVGQETVMEALSEHTRGILENQSMLDPAVFIKNKREELREAEASITYTEGQVDLLEVQRQKALDTIDDVIKRGEEINRRKDELEAKQYDGIDIEELRQRQMAVAQQFSDAKRQELLKKQAELKSKQYESKFTEEMKKVYTKLQALYEKQKHLAQQMKSIRPGSQCPVCRTQITDAVYPVVMKGYQAELIENGSLGKSAQTAYRELIELDKKSREKFEEFRAADLKQVEAQLAQMESGDISDIAMLEDQIRIGNLTQQEFEELTQIREKAAEYAKEVEALCKTDAYPAEVEKLKESIQQSRQQIKSIQSMIHAAGEYAAKRAELTFRGLKMNRAAIKLFEVAKTTGEVKDVFKFTYDGKDYRWLSASEKIKAGLEVAQLLQNLTGISYPTYIDNAEGITTRIDRIDGQMICAIARKGELNVQIPSRARKDEVAA